MFQLFRQVARQMVGSLIIVITVLVSLTACTPNGLPNAQPSFSLLYRGTDGELHARWSADGTTWNDPNSFPSSLSSSSGPGQSGIPQGLTQEAFYRIGPELRRLSSIGSSEYDSTGSTLIESGFSSNSAISAAFLGSGKWLLAHRSGNDAVIRQWDGSGTTRPVTPVPGIANLCQPDNFSGPVGPKVVTLNNLLLVGFCQVDAQGVESLKLITGSIDSSGNPVFSSVSQFPRVETGFQRPTKAFSLAQDGSMFLLAAVANETNPPGQLVTSGLFIYESNDGVSWTLRTGTSRTSGLMLTARETPLGIAALPANGNTPPLILVAQYAGTTQSPTLWSFDGSRWDNRSQAGAFGAPPDLSVEFSFRGNGRS